MSGLARTLRAVCFCLVAGTAWAVYPSSGPDHVVRALQWCWFPALENASLLSRCQCQHVPVKLALWLSEVHQCDWFLPKLVLTYDLRSSPTAQETARPNHSSSLTSAHQDGRAPDGNLPHQSTTRKHLQICMTFTGQIRPRNIAAWGPKTGTCPRRAPLKADDGAAVTAMSTC